MSAIQPAIRSAIQPAIRSALASSGAAVWSPLTLFAASEVGVWYDPSDFSTMYQDSAGTTPVTAVGQPVGLILDKSDGLVLGPELVTNGDFSAGLTGWSAGTSYTASGGVVTQTGLSSLTQVAVVQSGTWYRVSIDVTEVTASGNCSFQLAGVNGAQFSVTTTGTVTQYLLATATGSLSFVHRGSATFRGSLDNFSCKVLLGNHASQATAASRLLSATGGAVDFDGTDDSVAQSAGGGSTTGFMLVAAIKPEGGAGTVRNIWSDTGTNTGYVVRINASNQLEMAVGNGSAYTTVATTATLDVGTAYVVSAWDDGTNLNVQINSGTVASVTRPTVSAGSSTSTIGKSNTSAASYFNGLMYQVLQTKNDGGTDAERTEAKAYCATKGGVTL